MEVNEININEQDLISIAESDLNTLSNDQFSFDLCRQQIKNYLAQVKVYQQCVINETNEEADKLIKKFNCHAQGNSMCF